MPAVRVGSSNTDDGFMQESATQKVERAILDEKKQKSNMIGAAKNQKPCISLEMKAKHAVCIYSRCIFFHFQTFLILKHFQAILSIRISEGFLSRLKEERVSLIMQWNDIGLTMLFEVGQGTSFKAIRCSLARNGLLTYAGNHLGNVDERPWKKAMTFHT